ncbi:MAG: type II secretion system protein [Smithella sp.]
MMKHSFGKYRGQGGFTMIEIISVLVIIAIVTAVVITRMASTKDYDLAAQTEVVKTHLRLAQSRAMNSSQIWGINISGNTVYSLFNNGNTANVVRLPSQNADNVTLPAGMTITTGIVSFDAWGKPYTDAAGTAAQSGERTLTLSKGGDSKTISITQNTGYIP